VRCITKFAVAKYAQLDQLIGIALFVLFNKMHTNSSRWISENIGNVTFRV